VGGGGGGLEGGQHEMHHPLGKISRKSVL